MQHCTAARTCMIYNFGVFGFATFVQPVIDTTMVIRASERNYSRGYEDRRRAPKIK